MNQNIPNTFDWVTERAKCTPFKVFEALRSQVEEDMNRRNRLPVESGVLPGSYIFQQDAQWFAVIHSPNRVAAGVSFHITECGVLVRDVETRTDLFEGVLTISDDGLCRLKVGEREYDFWQFRKRALQEMFFVNRQVTP